MKRTIWTERKFTFDFPEGWLWNVLERLHGTRPRIMEIVSGFPESTLEKKLEGWSIKEHVGHLIDLESLHEARIDDFIARKEVLTAADMTNAKTYEANHNQRKFEDLLNEFSAKRQQFIQRLHKLDESTQMVKALHPRLKVHMRPVDVAYFTAEHDDHHLATMRAITQKLKS